MSNYGHITDGDILSIYNNWEDERLSLSVHSSQIRLLLLLFFMYIEQQMAFSKFPNFVFAISKIKAKRLGKRKSVKRQKESTRIFSSAQ